MIRGSLSRVDPCCVELRPYERSACIELKISSARFSKSKARGGFALHNDLMGADSKPQSSQSPHSYSKQAPSWCGGNA